MFEYQNSKEENWYHNLLYLKHVRKATTEIPKVQFSQNQL